MLRALSMFTLLSAVVAGTACTSDHQKKDDAGDLSAGDAGGDASSSGTADANADVPLVQDEVDAGHIDDTDGDHIDAGTGGEAGAEGIAVDGPGTPPGHTGPKVDPIQVTIFNRLLVKPKDSALGAGQVQAIAEAATGATVAKVRRTAGTFWLVEFAPTSPPRKAAEQKALIAALQKQGGFTVVEGDQIMTIKQPSGKPLKKGGFGIQKPQ